MDSFLVRFPAFLVLDSSPFAYWLLSPLSSFGAGVFCPQLSFCFSSLQCFVTDMPRGGESSRLVCPSVVAHCDAAGSRVSKQLISQSHIAGGLRRSATEQCGGNIAAVESGIAVRREMRPRTPAPLRGQPSAGGYEGVGSGERVARTAKQPQGPARRTPCCGGFAAE